MSKKQDNPLDTCGIANALPAINDFIVITDVSAVPSSLSYLLHKSKQSNSHVGHEGPYLHQNLNPAHVLPMTCPAHALL